MARTYRGYSDQDVIENSKQVYSLSALLKSLKLKCAGGNFINMKRKLQQLNVDTSHWTGQAWNKDERLKDWSQYTKNKSIKRHLLKINDHQCSNCLLKIWLDFPIKLELHHINGDRTNNKLENLQLLCSNCHAMTDNYRSKKRNQSIAIEKISQISKPKLKIKPKIKLKDKILCFCQTCQISINKRSTYCKICAKNKYCKTKIVWPSANELEKLVWEMPTQLLAIRLGISDKAIEKHCKKLNILKPPRGYWAKKKVGKI